MLLERSLSLAAELILKSHTTCIARPFDRTTLAGGLPQDVQCFWIQAQGREFPLHLLDALLQLPVG